MKTIILAFLFLTNIINNDCTDLQQIRNNFESNPQKEKEILSVIEICEKSNCYKTTPYHAVFLMKKAELTWNPIKRLSLFNEGKKLLEDFVKEYPKNIEGKYIRWLVQKKAPSYLGYNTNLTEDLKFITENIAASDIEKSYQKVMLNHIERIKNE